jgi:hypothetical protein
MIQKWEIFCTECRRVMTFARTVAGPPDAPWICSDTPKPTGNTVTGCGAEATFSANGLHIRKGM